MASIARSPAPASIARAAFSGDLSESVQMIDITSWITEGSSENLAASLINLSIPPFSTIAALFESLPATCSMTNNQCTEVLKCFRLKKKG